MTDSKAGAVQIFLLPQLVEALSSAPSVIQTDLFAFILSSLLNVSSTGTPFFSNPLIF